MLKIFVRPVMGGFEPPPTPPPLNTPLATLAKAAQLVKTGIEPFPGYLSRTVSRQYHFLHVNLF